jgi:protein-L-isoaspartate(D-aspartate) O-methyltransferase
MLGDGTLGWREHAPYDAILVSAGAPDVPRPLLDQLSEGGRMIVPLGDMEEQMLAMVTRHGDSFERRDIAPVRFVPLWGTHGWSG